MLAPLMVALNWGKYVGRSRTTASLAAGGADALSSPAAFGKNKKSRR